MKIFLNNLIFVLITVTSIQGECDFCHKTNNEACHSETEYSLCINGEPSGNIITCPEDHVCTSGPYVCYPAKEAEASCKRNCGVCSKNKVFACLNETTIAFCYGEDNPVERAEFSYCLGDTVCDINSKDGFCTDSRLVEPSCKTVDSLSTRESPNATKQPSFISIEPNISTATSSDESRDTPTTTVGTLKKTAATTPLATTTKPTTIIELTTTTMELTSTTAETSNEQTQTTATTDRTKPFEIVSADLVKTKDPTTTIGSTTTTKELMTETTEILTMEAMTTPTRSTVIHVTNAQPSTKAEITTTESTTQTSTTQQKATPRDPNTICRDAKSIGFYYADDPTCTTFVVCYRMKGSLAGLKKKCPENQYFVPDGKICSSEKPDVCV